MNRRIALSLAEGRVVRDFFENGLLNLLLEHEVDIACFTPSARVAEFVKKWASPRVQFHLLKPYAPRGRAYRGVRIRDQLLKRGELFSQFWKWLQPYFFRADEDYEKVLRDADLAVLTNPLFYTEMGIYSTASALGIPTLGVIRSWDNLFKGFRFRPDMLAVWNSINRQEAMSMMRYDPQQVIVVGATQFDSYFDPNSNWGRERFARTLGLDAAKPIITLATLGAFLPLFDETYLVDVLLGAIQSDEINRDAQLIIRLHPASKLENFSKYMSMQNVHISYITGYIPTLGWTMTREDVIQTANLLRHSDVVVSPGSTITIETAIFDTPTIMPVFNAYQPELNKEQYDRHLSTHFKRLADLDLVPIIREQKDLIPAVNRALADKTWYREQRARLVQDYVHFTDGYSTQRLTNLMFELMKGKSR